MNVSDPATGRLLLGDDVPWSEGLRLTARFPVPCKIRLLRSGQLVQESAGDTLDFRVDGQGVFRVEGWLPLDGEDRAWVYSNPIYVR
jgi:hypothetical protein